MSRDLRARLLATPLTKLPGVGLGEYANDPSIKLFGSLAQRRTWVRQGFAMQDGTLPIPNVQHLKYALEAYEFAENRRKAQRWITRRAKALSRVDLLPEAWQRPTIVAAAGDEVVVHTGAMIALYPPLEIAELLAGPSATDEPAEELHVTLASLGEAEQYTASQTADIVSALAAVVEAFPGLTASVQGWGTFVGKKDKGNPQWYSINSLGLAALRSELVLALQSNGIPVTEDYDFVPHMTVRYGDQGITSIPDGGEKEWPVTELFLVAAGYKLPLSFTNDIVDSTELEEDH